jgi:hypothetical protein
VVNLDWHNDMSKLLLDINDQIELRQTIGRAALSSGSCEGRSSGRDPVQSAREGSLHEIATKILILIDAVRCPPKLVASDENTWADLQVAVDPCHSNVSYRTSQSERLRNQ